MSIIVFRNAAILDAQSAHRREGCDVVVENGTIREVAERPVNLSGAEEVPPVKTSATGSGSFRLAEDGTITGSVTTKDVAGTAAHIHLGAKGKNGPVIVPLAKNGDTYSVPAGRKLTEAQVKAFKQGELYVNVHSARHRGGEVRAQIVP